MSYPTAFNARNITASEVAASFVVPDEEIFKQIVARKSLVLIGPRGIGKTTLMKILTPSGLYGLRNRSDLSGLFNRLNIDYIPIYIPAETLWKGNATVVGSHIPDEGLQYRILNGLFVFHCLHELIMSIEDARYIASLIDGDLPAWTLKINDEQEEEISRLCSRSWCLDRVETSFIGLKLAVLDRSNLFHSAINSWNNSEALTAIGNIRDMSILILLKAFFDIIDRVIGRQLWSIQFDEMEIAPKKVLANLYENLRSFDHRAVLKFSLFPYVDFYELDERVRRQETGPSEGEDYIAVVLTYKFANPDYRFAKSLVELACFRRGVSMGDFVNYLNRSSAITPRTRKGGEERADERDFERIFDIAKARRTDRDFLRFLDERGISTSEDIRKITGNKRAEQIRKIAPIAEFRSYYLTERTKFEGGIRRRSVKGYGYYHGFHQILDLTEGNPRSLNFYVNDLLDSFQSGEESSTAQNRAIARNVNRFRALVATQAVPAGGNARLKLNALNAVDRLGANASLQLLDVKFRPEPALSYKFHRVDEETISLLGIAINTGALIVERANLIFDIENCRARISYRLAPFYPLPTITGQPMILSRIPSGETTFGLQSDLLAWGNEDA